MTYKFDFTSVLAQWPLFVHGAWLTVKLSLAATLIGLLIGTLCAVGRGSRNPVVARACAIYVEAIRNTPLLVQIFLVYFGLASIGLKVPAFVAAVLAMVINVGAYTTEIMRAGIESIHKSQIEAAECLALSRAQIYWHVILRPAMERVYPALTSQFVLLMLATSITSQISAEELTAIANRVQSDTFRSFETYAVVAVFYLLLSLLMRGAFWAAGPGTVHTPPQAGNAVVNIVFNSHHLVFLLQGAGWTLVLSLIAFVGGGLVGFIVALCRISPSRSLRWLSMVYVQLVQGTPLLILMFLAYFGLSIVGLTLPALVAAGISMTIYVSAYIGEIWRGCIQAVPRTQWEAAECLALSRVQRMGLVVLPQALRIATPPTVGFMVQIVKNTSLASVVGFVELARAGQVVNNSLFEPFLVYMLVAGLYFLLCFPLSWWSRQLERRLLVGHRVEVAAA